jgi:excisionase family DNA binding protein
MMAPDREAAIRSAVDALVTAILAAATPEPADAPDRLLSVDEAAAQMGIGRSMLYDLIAGQRIISIKVGRRRLLASGVIADYIRAGGSSPVRVPSVPGEGRDRSGTTPKVPARRRSDPKAAA